MNRFADYFFICGLDLNSGMEPDRVAGDNLRISPIERSYKGKVLAHYPDKVGRNPFDASAICMLSMPGGLKFRTQKHAVAQAPAFHSFVVTREDAHRYYGFSLVFYEEVKNRDICTAMQTLQAMYITELSSEIHIRPQSQESRSLPRHFRLSAQGPNGYSTSAAHYDITRDRLLVSKCIGIVCQRAYVHASRLFLENLYRCATCKNKPAHGQNGARSLESYVFNLLYEVEVPAAGKSLLIQLPPPDPRLPPARAVIQSPAIPLELPHFDFPLRPLFQWLGVEAALRLFTCLLLEHQVLLRSSDAQRLMIVAEGITTLLFPFTWPHVYVPILPAALHHFLDAPVPYLMGLHTAVDNVNTGAGALCYVDIDKCRIQVPEEVPEFPHADSFLLELRACLDRHSVRLPGPDAVSHSPGAPRGLSSTLPCKPRQRLAMVDVMESERPPSPPGSARSEALQRIADIVRRTGVALDAAGEGGGTDTPTDGYIEDVKLNTAVREIFLNRFLHTFQHYENFVIYPPECPGVEENRECFDKASFLSDQPEQHRPFLWRFLESQMFATFIDGKVAGGTSPELRIFDARLRSLLQHHGGARPLTYEPCAHSHDLQRLAEHRLSSPDYESPPPREILATTTAHSNRQFPLLSREVLNGTPVTSQGSIPRAGGKAGLPPLPCGAKRGERKTTGEVSSPALIAQANWTFVETLLKDCKAKTKRMVLAKLGSEEDPGGGPATCTTTSSGIEESTLVASLCDFLERVWAHGLQRRRGKSALWSHLATYQERAVSGSDSGHRRELLHDIEAVQAMKEVRTCIGKARAWIRLALEKKQLSRHVRELLAGDPDLLRHHYRRSAFLRCEEEREQFLYHLLSLNAVDYYCFTNTYATASMPYRITIVPTRKGSTCSSNVWVVLSGTLSETRRISIPRGSVTFDHKNQNIGVLTTLRIGHDNAGMNARWMVDYVLVKNMITGHLFKFPCGRWLGRGVDDGSSERLLIGSLLPTTTSENEEPSSLGGSGHTTPRSHSPGPPPRTPDLKPSQIQHLLGDCVNSIVKWQYRRAADRTGALTVLLCGDQGLAACLEKVFLYGFKSGRLFTGRLYLWDYLCRVREQFEGDLQEDSGGGSIGRSASLERSQREASATRRACCRLLREISSSSSSLGKDGKFQLFVCLAFREHLLRRMLGPLVSTRATQELYEEHSFLRQRSLLTFLTQILLPLDDIDVVLEKSVTYGISSTSLP